MQNLTFEFNLSKLEFDSVAFNLNLKSVLQIRNLFKDYCAEDFWLNYFEKHNDYSFFSNYSIEENIHINIFIEELVKSNPRSLIEQIRMTFLNHERNYVSLSYINLVNIPISFGIGALVNLKELILDGNQITEIPKEIGNLVNLKELCARDNRITEIPKEIGNLVNLEVLILFGNRITKIPKEIGNLVNLDILDLDNNQITEIPKEIGNLVNLERLDLSNNQISEFPKEIGNLVKLEELNSDENLIKEIPKEIGNLVNLKELKLIIKFFTFQRRRRIWSNYIIIII